MRYYVHKNRCRSPVLLGELISLLLFLATPVLYRQLIDCGRPGWPNLPFSIYDSEELRLKPKDTRNPGNVWSLYRRLDRVGPISNNHFNQYNIWTEVATVNGKNMRLMKKMQPQNRFCLE